MDDQLLNENVEKEILNAIGQRNEETGGGGMKLKEVEEKVREGHVITNNQDEEADEWVVKMLSGIIKVVQNSLDNRICELPEIVNTCFVWGDEMVTIEMKMEKVLGGGGVMKIYQCDRCGRISQTKPTTAAMGLSGPPRRMFRATESSVDLCRRCLQEFITVLHTWWDAVEEA